MFSCCWLKMLKGQWLSSKYLCLCIVICILFSYDTHVFSALCEHWTLNTEHVWVRVYVYDHASLKPKHRTVIKKKMLNVLKRFFFVFLFFSLFTWDWRLVSSVYIKIYSVLYCTLESDWYVGFMRAKIQMVNSKEFIAIMWICLFLCWFYALLISSTNPKWWGQLKPFQLITLWCELLSVTINFQTYQCNNNIIRASSIRYQVGQVNEIPYQHDQRLQQQNHCLKL